MRTLGLLAIVSLTACKGNFQLVADASSEPDAPADAPPSLACAPTRFSAAGMVNAAFQDPPPLVNQLAVTATPRGYHVFIVDASNSLHGVSYEFVDGELVEKARTAEPIITNVTGAIGAIALDPGAADNAEVLLAVPCAPGSTTLIPLDAQLRPASDSSRTYGEVAHDGWMGGHGSLVRSDTGRLVFLAVKDGTSEIYARAVSRLGVDQDNGSPRLVDTAGNAPIKPMITRAGTGYLVAWETVDTAPNEVQATVLDDQLNVATPATKISPDITETMSDSDLPAVAYSATSKLSLFAWVIKVGSDQVWFSLRDERLQKTSQVVATMPDGNAPVIVAGKDDFLVVWTDAGGARQLSAARIAPDGTFTRPGLSTTGGTAPAWDLVVRNGQPALIWFEEVGSGPYVWFDPLCTPN